MPSLEDVGEWKGEEEDTATKAAVPVAAPVAIAPHRNWFIGCMSREENMDDVMWRAKQANHMNAT